MLQLLKLLLILCAFKLAVLFLCCNARERESECLIEDVSITDKINISNKIGDECDCTLPNDLTGKWYFSVQGNVEAGFLKSDTMLLPYQGQTLPLYCVDIADSTYYLFLSDHVDYRGGKIYVGICITFEKINSDVYLFVHKTEKNLPFGNLRVALRHTTTATKSALCNDMSNEENYIMIRKGGNFVSACPSEILGIYDYSFIIGHDACSKDGISGDFCNDTTTLDFGDTTSCSDRIGYSKAAKVQCIHHKTIDSKNYLWTYNTDVSTDESYTFRISCFMYEVNGTSLNMTQNPKNCDEAQTATSPNTDVVGGKFSGTLTSCPTATPPTTTTTTPNTTEASTTVTKSTVPTTTGNLTGSFDAGDIVLSDTVIVMGTLLIGYLLI